MPSAGHRPPTSWRFKLYSRPTITINHNRFSSDATSRPLAPSKVAIDFQHSLKIRYQCHGFPGSTIVGPLNTESIVYKKDASVFCNALSAERAINQMFFSTPSWWFTPSIWRVPVARDIAARIFAKVSNICNIRQDVALISFVLVVTKEVHIMMDGVTNLAFQQSFDQASQLVQSIRPAPPELLESLVTDECATLEGETEDCIICLEELNGRVNVKRLPCSHRFHGNCILRWFTEKDFCPICRYTYVTVPPRE